MYFGMTSLSRFGFIGAGFWVVMVTAFALGLVYVVGSSRGRVAAQQWLSACMLLLGVGGIADISWALVSGQWRAFMVQFGFGALLEMLVLAALFIGTMWFMAVRYVGGLDK